MEGWEKRRESARYEGKVKRNAGPKDGKRKIGGGDRGGVKGA